MFGESPVTARFPVDDIIPAPGTECGHTICVGGTDPWAAIQLLAKWPSGCTMPPVGVTGQPPYPWRRPRVSPIKKHKRSQIEGWLRSNDSTHPPGVMYWFHRTGRSRQLLHPVVL